MQIRRPTPAMTTVGIIAVLLYFRVTANEDTLPRTGRRYSVLVARVYDGDTFETSTGQRVRLLGIDAPEVAHQDTPGEPFGEESGAWLSTQVLQKTVLLEEGVEPVDRYGRTLAWVYQMDGTLVNELALATGQAKLLGRFGLPQHLEPKLRNAESEAKLQLRGLWAGPAK